MLCDETKGAATNDAMGGGAVPVTACRRVADVLEALCGREPVVAAHTAPTAPSITPVTVFPCTCMAGPCDADADDGCDCDWDC